MNRLPEILLIVLAGWCPVAAQELGPAPLAGDLNSARQGLLPAASVVSVPSGDRAAVVALYRDVYLASQSAAPGWTGNRSTCTAGTTTPAYADATILRVNLFRALAGLPGTVTLSNAWNTKCQEAALMMSAANALSHSPDTNWACSTAGGREAAGKSNLALGTTGPGAIDLYVDDPGSGNTAAGHRRWILYPPARVMGTGSIPSGGGSAAQALWVIGGAGSRPPQPAWVSWPPPGFIPYQLLPRSSRRWSFSHPGASFSNTKVFMQCAGTNLTLTIEPLAQGYGDNTIVWVPQGVSSSAPAADTTYTVTVSNVVVGSESRMFTYRATVIDPNAPVLVARVAGPNSLLLAWPSTVSGYSLQETTSPADPASWQNVTFSPQNSGGEYRVTVPVATNPQFFRLRKP